MEKFKYRKRAEPDWVELADWTWAFNVPGGVLIRFSPEEPGDGRDGVAGLRIAAAMSFVPGTYVDPDGNFHRGSGMFVPTPEIVPIPDPYAKPGGGKDA